MKALYIIMGLKSALARQEDEENWRNYFNLSRQGLKISYVALALTLLCYLICAFAAISHYNDRPNISLAAISLILGLYLVSFPLTAYFLCQLFDRMDQFRPWVILRHWGHLVLAALMALFMGSSLLGLSYTISARLCMLAYLAILALDIRLAQIVLKMEWSPAIFTACGIAIIGLAMLMSGLATIA